MLLLLTVYCTLLFTSQICNVSEAAYSKRDASAFSLPLFWNVVCSHLKLDWSWMTCVRRSGSQGLPKSHPTIPARSWGAPSAAPAPCIWHLPGDRQGRTVGTWRLALMCHPWGRDWLAPMGWAGSSGMVGGAPGRWAGKARISSIFRALTTHISTPDTIFSTKLQRKWRIQPVIAALSFGFVGTIDSIYNSCVHI